MKNAETLSFIYAILLKVHEKSLTVEEAFELIREIFAR